MLGIGDVVTSYNQEYLSKSCVICGKPLRKNIKKSRNVQAVMRRVTCRSTCLAIFRKRRNENKTKFGA